MLISLKRAGGFAGIEQALGSVDVSTLGEAEARAALSRLQELIRLAPALPSPGADRLQYEVEVRETGIPTRTIVIFDEGDPDRADMRALLDLAGALGLRVH